MIRLTIHLSNGAQGFLSFKTKESKDKALANIAQAKWEGHMWSVVGNDGKTSLYNPDHIIFVEET